MDVWFEFILDRYNYWIVIILMMTGLYTVFARGNLVKKIVGLNLFQTSAFIFYITIGKISGGTAPIYRGGELDHGGGHESDGHISGGDHDGAESHGGGTTYGADDHVSKGAASLHAKIDNTALDHDNDLKEALKSVDPAPADAGPSLHTAPGGDASKIVNDVLAEGAKTPPPEGFDVAGADGAADAAGDAANDAALGAADALNGATEIILYTNPLPHVLILTAIVVGVATTAVGLALAVRIREAYGTIEEDELGAADDIAQFGHVPGAPAQQAAGTPS